MRPLFCVLLASFFAAAPAFAADKFEFDKAHTNTIFFINHLGFSDMIGVFTQYDGSFNFDSKKPEDSKIDVVIHPAGIRTSSAPLDKELQGDKFFNTATYPDIHFVSRQVAITGENTADVTGDLTMLGVTKPMVLHVKLNKEGYNPMTKDFMAGFGAEGTIKRSDFGMTYGLPMVGDEVRIVIQTEAIDTDRKKIDAMHHE